MYLVFTITTSGGVYVHCIYYNYLWWSLCSLYLLARQVRFYGRRLGSLLLCLRDVFRALINSVVCQLLIRH